MRNLMLPLLTGSVLALLNGCAGTEPTPTAVAPRMTASPLPPTPVPVTATLSSAPTMATSPLPLIPASVTATLPSTPVISISPALVPATATQLATSVPTLRPGSTATPTPVAGGLIAGATLVLGPAEARIDRVAEAMVSPVQKKPAPPGQKFVQIELRLTQLRAGASLASEQLVLLGPGSAAYTLPRIYGTAAGVGDYEAETATVSSAPTDLRVFFAVPASTHVTALTLAYR